jgi:hypothetical protein
LGILERRKRELQQNRQVEPLRRAS